MSENVLFGHYKLIKLILNQILLPNSGQTMHFQKWVLSPKMIDSLSWNTQGVQRVVGDVLNHTG